MKNKKVFILSRFEKHIFKLNILLSSLFDALALMLGKIE